VQGRKRTIPRHLQPDCHVVVDDVVTGLAQVPRRGTLDTYSVLVIKRVVDADRT
jgi:hypothetical protein